MGELCFALFRLPNSLGSGGGVGILLHGRRNHEKFRWVGLSWESGLVREVAVGRAVCALAPTSLGSAYTMNPGKGGVQRTVGMPGEEEGSWNCE